LKRKTGASWFGWPEPKPICQGLARCLRHGTRAGRLIVDLERLLNDDRAAFTLITNTLAKDKEISDRWRGFEDVADSRHLANRVEAPVVDALVEAVREAYPKLSHRYYAMKAKLARPRQAECTGTATRRCRKSQADTIAWDTAQGNMVLDAYAGSRRRWPTLPALLRQRWIDAPSPAGQGVGAFAHPTVPSAHPYVLLNYLGKPRDVMTLAHELGHGVHQVLAARAGRADGINTADAGRNGVVFGEMLTFRVAAEQTTDRKEAQGAAGGQGRRHAQHGGAPDRVLQFEREGARTAAAKAS
jgi:oligoendopeptidase F